MLDGDEVIGVIGVKDADVVVTATSAGHVLHCKAEEINKLEGPGRGVTVVKTGDDERVIGFVAGATAPPGRRMGHAGAIISGASGTAEEKFAAFEAAGMGIMRRPVDVIELLKGKLK